MFYLFYVYFIYFFSFSFPYHSLKIHQPFQGLKLEYPRELCQATVHIDVPAAQSGVSRYMESRCGFWKYSKEEELSDQVGVVVCVVGLCDYD